MVWLARETDREASSIWAAAGRLAWQMVEKDDRGHCAAKADEVVWRAAMVGAGQRMASVFIGAAIGAVGVFGAVSVSIGCRVELRDSIAGNTLGSLVILGARSDTAVVDEVGAARVVRNVCMSIRGAGGSGDWSFDFPVPSAVATVRYSISCRPCCTV